MRGGGDATGLLDLTVITAREYGLNYFKEDPKSVEPGEDWGGAVTKGHGMTQTK